MTANESEKVAASSAASAPATTTTTTTASTTFMDKFLSKNSQIALINHFRTTVPWGVLCGICSVLYAMNAPAYRYIMALALLHFSGILPTPPIFKLFYKLYCSETVGYRFVRPAVHARLPASHSEYFPSVRSLRRGNQVLARSQKHLSKILRKFAEDGGDLSIVSDQNKKKGGARVVGVAERDILIFPIPVLNDNYAYALIYPSSPSSSSDKKEDASLIPITLQCILIDAADPTRIIIELERQLILAGSAEASLFEDAVVEINNNNVEDDSSKKNEITTVLMNNGAASPKKPFARRIVLNIAAILTTHKHWDHAGGNKEWAEMAAAFASAAASSSSQSPPPLLDQALRHNLIQKVNSIESRRRRNERKKRIMNKKNEEAKKKALAAEQGTKAEDGSSSTTATASGKSKTITLKDAPLDPETFEPMVRNVFDAATVSDGDISEDTDMETTTNAPTSSKSKSGNNTTLKAKTALNPYRYFMGEADNANVAGLITFSPDLKFYGSKVDNPHCTNVFVENFDQISIDPSATDPRLIHKTTEDTDDENEKINGNNESSSSLAVITCLDAPGHTRGSIMFLLSLAEAKEQSMFAAELKEAGLSSGNGAKMSHVISRALFTGDCIFCGGCGAMFETRSARDTMLTYDCFMGSSLTSSPIRDVIKLKQQAAAKTGGTLASAVIPDPNFYISSRNILLFVGHEYTFKLMSGLMDMVSDTKEKLIKASEEEARKEKKAKEDREAAAAAAGAPAMEDRKDITTVALDEILAEATAKSGVQQEDGGEKKLVVGPDGKLTPASKAGVIGADGKKLPTKVLHLRPHHAAIEARWNAIMRFQNHTTTSERNSHLTNQQTESDNNGADTDDTSKALPIITNGNGLSFATVPATLYDERRTNPLLTLERSMLLKLVFMNAHASRIEETVYGSDERRTKL